MTQSNLIIDEDYISLINGIKQQVKSAQLKAHRAVNTELISMYWAIGKELIARQKTEQWGSKYLEQVSADLMIEFPGMKGLSKRNLEYMRQFSDLFNFDSIAQQPAAQLGWSSIMLFLDKKLSINLSNWYAQQAIEQGWSRNVLSHMIETELHLSQKEANKITNFKNTLPQITSDMAQAMFKDPYCLEFMGIQEVNHERDLENALVDNIRDFLLHLGKGFAFIGNQYKLVVGGDEFFIDMLFFNTELNAYIVIELKTTKFSLLKNLKFIFLYVFFIYEIPSRVIKLSG